MFGPPQQKRDYYELQEILTGEPADPFSGF